jgi:REP element-mobilizing transposase RayT
MAELRFGDLDVDRIVLNDAGTMVGELWMANVVRHPGAALDAFIVMPNHLHAIVLIGAEPGETTANLNDVVGMFKSLSTAAYGQGVRSGSYPPYEIALWQRSYYDRIIRDAADLERTRAYIEGNQARWIEKYQSAPPRPHKPVS